MHAPTLPAGYRPTFVLECVVNISEGRRPEVVDAIARVAGQDLLDVHRDPDHNRAVLTLVGTAAPRAVAHAAVAGLDLSFHTGVHPRMGVVDVVPFVPLEGSTMAEAVAARDAFAHWVGTELGVPAFCYGRERTLPEVRRRAFVDLAPDAGPALAHPRAGAVAVGARQVLVAYNLVLAGEDLALARTIARAVRGPSVRALGLAVTGGVQVSMNLVDPERCGPAEVYDLVAGQAAVSRAELVGLVPASVVDATDPERWDQLDLDPARTIEARLGTRRPGRA